jgi:hypothetical protein
MRQSIALLELIFSLFILFGITLFTATFYNNIFQYNHAQQESAKHHIDLLSTQLFIFKLLQYSKIDATSSQSINFLQTDYENFLSNTYWGYVDLNNSSKIKLNTPQSQTQQLQAQAILFNNDLHYALKPSHENNYLFFQIQIHLKRFMKLLL